VSVNGRASTDDRASICLIRPPAVETFRFSSLSITPPLGLAYVAGALEHAGERVTVVDAVAEAPKEYRRYFKGYLIGLPFEAIARRVPPATEVVGITVVFTHEWPAIVRLIDEIKKQRPDVTIVLGGEHVTSMPEFCLVTSRADVLVLGEGEETMLELVHALRDGTPIDCMPGIAHRVDRAVVVNPRRNRRLEIDDIPWPAWHHIDLDTYHEHRWMGGMYSSTKSVPILATRGCPYQCTYCSAPNMWTPRWIPRSPAKVADEIQYYYDNYGARDFPFQDLTAIIRREWIIDFCHEILDRGLDITWQMPTGTRSEAIDFEVAQLLRRTGLITMAYAPESGSEETRRLIKKKMKSDRLLESMRAAKDADLNVQVFMVIGFPHDTESQLRDNLPFVELLAETGITDCSVAFYMALPGTEMFDSLYDSGKIKIDKRYFQHILSSTAIWSTSTFCEELGNVKLTIWKFRLLRRFYKKRERQGSSGFVKSIRQAITQLGGEKSDASKLQTAFRNGMESAVQTARSQFRRGWISRAEQRAMFETWDDLFREIRETNLRDGARVLAPSDTRKLHETNVIKTLKDAHSKTRRIPVRSA
jgi:radical SAM superfamily enzyme YgiQ (UPF0313 family)